MAKWTVVLCVIASVAVAASLADAPRALADAPRTPAEQDALDRSVIRRYIRRNLKQITACYEHALHDHPELAGTVESHFTIGATGQVTDAHAEGVHPDVSGCIAATILQIKFPTPKGGGTVTVNYPFVFHSSSPPSSPKPTDPVRAR